MNPSDNGRRDVVIHAPTAKASAPFGPTMPVPTPAEIIQLQAARIRELEVESQQRTVAASTIANVTICLCKRLRDLGYAEEDGSLFIPAEVEQRTRGMQLTVANTPGGDVVVNVREQEKPAPIAYEDRRD